ncbi:hypothetical protein V2J09_015260 [Rumex salicifolius]
MNYVQKLRAEAKAVLESDSGADEARLSFQEIGINAILKPHQLEGVSWLIRRYTLGVNVVLVVLCPLSVTDSWVSEIKKYASKLRVLRYIGDKEHREALHRNIYEHMQSHSISTATGFPFDVLLTTYDIALVDQDFLCQFPWHFTVIDEAQRLKNPSSVLYNVLTERFVMPRRLLMTGTPIQNNLTELWALMHFCMPSSFGTLEQFLGAFKEAGDPSSGRDNVKVNKQLQSLKCILRAFMLRRTKSKLIEGGTLTLPPLTEITVLVPLVALQKKVYLSILRKELSKLLAIASGTSSMQSLQNMEHYTKVILKRTSKTLCRYFSPSFFFIFLECVIQLRKACSHPYLFPGIEPEPYEEGEHLMLASGKLIILDQLLQRLHSSGHRVLIFAQMTHTLDILQDYLELRKYSYERLDGSIRAEERFAAIRNFSLPSSQSEDSGAFVFMISTRAGGVGLNLVAADTVIFYEQDWNPQVDQQALQRAHRIGQMNHVLCISLVAGNSIEEVIMRRAQRKLQLSHNVIGEDVVSQEEKGLSGTETGDLRSIIYGLHNFDLTEVSEEESGEPNMSVLSAIADKVISKRCVQQYEEDSGKIEISRMDLDGRKLNAVAESLDIDESSYLSWVEKFKEMSHTPDNSVMELKKRKRSDEEKRQRMESARKKAEEKKLSKWQSLGYESLSVADPILPQRDDAMSDHGAVQFVFGDCTRPSTTSVSEPAIIFSCVDDSGSWGRGGMFDALTKLSRRIPEAYDRASEVGDLHMGDLHLIELDVEDDKPPKWVALGVVQSYNPRRKVPRSGISIADLDSCVAKVSFSAAQKSASIHMPRVGHQAGSDRAVWYSTERILRKYASIYGVTIFVYYYKRS